jgi:hypothetical protein
MTDFVERVTLTLCIEDVTQAQRDQFMRHLLNGSVEIDMVLDDGLIYVANVLEGQPTA